MVDGSGKLEFVLYIIYTSLITVKSPSRGLRQTGPRHA